MVWREDLPLAASRRSERARRGLSLVEIMLASFILAVVMIPILQLIFGGIKDTARGRDRATAVALATNIMDQLLNKVPFSVIKTEGGPTPADPKEFFGSEDEAPGLYADKEQALLDDRSSEWEKILDQDAEPGDGPRTIVKEGTTFEVILFAGMYKDEDSGGGGGGGSFNKPSLTDELTFSYFRNPYVARTGSRAAELRKMVVLDGDDSEFPYNAEGESVTGVTRVDDPRFRAGWPKPADGEISDSNFYKGSTGLPSGSEDPNDDADHSWPRHTLDLSDFREEEGAMIKLVLGLRWKPGAGEGRKSSYTRTTKEFWLVSFKAKLEDR